MTTLHFAQISDIHISSLGDHHDMLSGRSAGFLTNILAGLNRIEDLDFVLITGDLFDTASQLEFDHLQQVIQILEKPYYIIPGNHDRRPPDRGEGLTRHQFAQHFNPQVGARPTAAEAQAGYWSIAVSPQVQIVGLDSIKDDDWSGIVDASQMVWLASELDQLTDKLVIIAIHHPLHQLSPIDTIPPWDKFLCDNGPELLALFDKHSQVKMVLTGHHHLNKVDKLGERFHLACPAIAIYPCAYRTFRLTQQADNSWRVEWQTHNATDEATIAEARETTIRVWQEVGFDPDFVRNHLPISLGSDDDRNGMALLTKD